MINKNIHNPLTVGEHLCNRRLNLDLVQSEVAADIVVTEDCITSWRITGQNPKLRNLPHVFYKSTSLKTCVSCCPIHMLELRLFVGQPKSETTNDWLIPYCKLSIIFECKRLFRIITVSGNCQTFLMYKALSCLVILFLFSCGDAGNQATNQNVDALANRFQHIKGKLEKFADKHDATISTVWSKVQKHDPDGSDSFLVKHIVWNDGRFGKAIFIQQHNGIEGVDTTTWDFSNIAWLQDTQATAKPTFVKNLLTKVEFQTIEKDIEQLLSKSEEVLGAIKVEDLK